MSEPTTPSGLVREGKPVTDWPTIRSWVLERDENQCQICHLRVATDVDHIWPRRLGGEDHVDNLRAACGPCNKSKGDRVDIEMATSYQRMLAIDALDKKIEALEQERNQFERAALIAAFADRELHAGAVYYRSHLACRRAALDVQITRWDYLLNALDYESVRHLPDAQVIELRPSGGAA